MRGDNDSAGLPFSFFLRRGRKTADLDRFLPHYQNHHCLFFFFIIFFFLRALIYFLYAWKILFTQPVFRLSQLEPMLMLAWLAHVRLWRVPTRRSVSFRASDSLRDVLGYLAPGGPAWGFLILRKSEVISQSLLASLFDLLFFFF